MRKQIDITAYRCKNCGRIHYPFHDRCLACRGREFEEIKPEGDARLLAYTAIFNLPWGFDQRFLIIGIGEFDNHVRAMGHIRADSVDGLEQGMRLKASWEPVRVRYGEPVYGLVYEPMA